LAQEPEGLSAPQGTANLSLRIFYVNRLSKQDWRAFFMRKFSNNQKEDKVMKKLSILFMVIFIFGLSTVGNVSAEIDVTKLLADDGAANDHFGQSVAVYGDTAVIGAPGYVDVGSSVYGAVYVFVRSGDTWTQQTKLTVTNGANDQFGYSVAVYGDTAVIGAYGDDDNGFNSGSAYVFVRSEDSEGIINWEQQAMLMADDGDIDDDGYEGDRFGYSVAVYGDTAVIGAYGDDADNGDNSGSAYVFVRSGNTWAQQDKLTAPADDVDTAGDYFGYSVAVYGDTAVIGAPGYVDVGSSAYGSAYVFVRSGNIWAQQDKLTADDGDTGDVFGNSVAVDGDTAVIGANNDDDNGDNSGSAYVFKLTPSDIDTVNVVDALESNCQLSVEILLKLTSPLGVKGMSTKKLTSPPGVKGMISKLTGNGSFAAKVAKAENDYANGNIDACTYFDELDGALNQLEGYDEQLEGKIYSGKIVDHEASELQTYSANMWILINDLISDANFSCSE